MGSLILQEALALRSANKIPEALVKLEEACKLNDPYALFMKGIALMFGGWGLSANSCNGADFIVKAEKLGVVFLERSEFFFIPDELQEIQLTFEIAEKINDANYWYHLGEQTKKIYAFKRGADQCHEWCIKRIQEIFGKNSLISVKYIILGKLYIQQEKILRNEGEELVFKHLIGKAILHDRLHPLKNSDIGKKAVVFYLQNIKASEMEVLIWLWISKKLNQPRDTSRLIALEIWGLRDEIWF